MRRTILLLAVILLVGGMLFASGKKEEQSSGMAEGVTLSIAHTRTGGAHASAFDAIIEQFESENPSITVEQTIQDDDLYEDTGLITMLQSNDPPDIFYQWGGALVTRDASQGHAADLTAELNKEGWGDSFVDAAWSDSAGTMYEGRIYMIPDSLSVTTAVWYNLDIFEQHGLSEPSSWDELVEISRTLAGEGVTPIVVGNQELWPLGNWAGHITAMAVGMDLFDRALRLEEPFNQPPFVEAFTRIRELADAGGFNQDIAGLGADPGMNAFFQGAAAMHPIGSWLVPIAAESAPEDLRYSVFNTPPLPGGRGDQTSVIGLATGHEVSAESDHFEEAVRFLRFFTSMESQIAWAEAGNFSPIEGAMERADLNPHTQELAELFEGAGSIVPPPDTGYPVEVADIFYQGAAYVAGGVRTPQEALAWIDRQLEQVE